MSGPTSPEGSPRRRVLVALGSNVEPARYLPLAVKRLAELFPGLRASRLYATEPVGAPGAPPFYNAAVALETERSLADLKHRVLRPLEAELGRRRGPDPNAPRTIDLDIALCGDLVLDDPVAGLRLPDPEIPLRAHLALPLADLEPELEHPVDGRPLEEIAAGFAAQPGVEVVAEAATLLAGRAAER